MATHLSSPVKTNAMDDVLKWPNVEYGDFYNYLIKTPGPFTKKAWMRTNPLRPTISFTAVMYVPFSYETSPASNYAVLLAKVNPSQKSVSNFHETWVLAKRNGSIKTAHCTCMAG